MLFLYLLLLIAASDLTFARYRQLPRGAKPRLIRHGMFGGTPAEHSSRHAPKATLHRRQAPNSGAAAPCRSPSQLTAKAPKTNIFADLSGQERASVTSFLHAQKSLNLTAFAEATAWDNKVLQVDLLQPNKSGALAYLDHDRAAPERYARAVILFGATSEPYIQEYQVGPLPVTNGSTTLTKLDYIYNKGRGYQRVYDADTDLLAVFPYQVAATVANITQKLLNGTATGDETGTLAIAGTSPLVFEGDRVLQWNQFYSIHTGPCYDEVVLPSGLMFKTDITGRDPSKWSVVAWQYNGKYYDSEAAFRRDVMSPSFVSPGTNVDGDWACTDYNKDPFPHDELNPPVPVQPDGSRFAVDEREQYVEWMDFTFYISFNKDFGLQLHNVRYKGERIIYEVGLQEALAHYASASDPFQASNAFLDSEYGFGLTSWQLVSGFDCPAYATYLNTSYYAEEISHTHPSSICLFELDTGYPIQRHIAPTYVSVTKNIQFVVRTAATVGNYDYIFDYEFFIDGSIHITVRASGYIQASFWASNIGSEDGFHIHDHLAGSMHSHVLNYKLDLDVAGTANSLVESALVPTTEVYPWSNGQPRNTMKLQRQFVDSEDKAKLNWDANNAVMYSVVNKEAKNKYGEYRGWKIMPATGQRNHLQVQNSSILGPSANWATHHLYAVQHKDSEPHSISPFNGNDPRNPMVDFNKFFNGESLDQEDIVIYFNLGMHHVPDTSDLPNTVYTSSHSSMILRPQNYLLGDPSRGTIHQTRINFVNGSVTDALTFGVEQPTCSLDLSVTAPNLQSWVGEVYVGKYPYHPDAQMVGNPGAGLSAASVQS